MNNITIIMPIHQIGSETEKSLAIKAMASVAANVNTFDGTLKFMTVCPPSCKDAIDALVKDAIGDSNVEVISIINEGPTDFCSQINCAVGHVDTPHFSILEMDDTYNPRWFGMAQQYYTTHEDVSLFLPFVVQENCVDNSALFCNELVWAMSFSDELGVVDRKCLEDCASFNITGGIFNTEDFKAIGGFKPSIEVAFNYELLLRLTEKQLKIYVIPRIGYHHTIGREDSLLDFYSKTKTTEEAQKWFALAKQECAYTEEHDVKIE